MDIYRAHSFLQKISPNSVGQFAKILWLTGAKLSKFHSLSRPSICA